MQSLIILLTVLQFGTPGQYPGLMPEVLVTAPRVSNDDPLQEIIQDMGLKAKIIDYSGLLPIAYAQTLPALEEIEDMDIDMDLKVKGTTFKGNYTLPAGDTVYDDVTVTGGNAVIDGIIMGDVAVMGGEVTIHGQVNGDVAVMGGNCDIHGTIDGDAAIFGGNMSNKGILTGDIFVVGGTVALDSGSTVEGDISMIGGAIDRNEYAVVNGEVTSIEAEAIHKILPRISRVLRFPGHIPGAEAFPRLFFVSMIIVLFVLNLLVMLIFPGTIEKITTALHNNVWASIGFGLGLQVLYIPLVLLFVISVIGIPLVPVFALVVFLAIIFGTTALSFIIGERVVNSFSWNVKNKIGIFCIGWLAAMILPIIVFLIGPPVFLFGFFIVYVIVTIGIGGVIWALIRKKNPPSKK